MNRSLAGFMIAVLSLFSLLIVQRTDLVDVFAQECGGVLVKHDEMFVTVELEPGVCGPDPIAHGDLNADGQRNLTDAVTLLNYLFLGGPEPAPLVVVECEAAVEGEACIRFFNDVTCNNAGFTASLDLSGCGTDPITTDSNYWSDCVSVPIADCEPCIRAVTGCGSINVCGPLNMVAGTVYSFVLYFDGAQPAVMLFEEPGDCTTPVPTPAGKGIKKAIIEGRAVIFGTADKELQGFASAR